MLQKSMSKENNKGVKHNKIGKINKSELSKKLSDGTTITLSETDIIAEPILQQMILEHQRNDYDLEKDRLRLEEKRIDNEKYNNNSLHDHIERWMYMSFWWFICTILAILWLINNGYNWMAIWSWLVAIVLFLWSKVFSRMESDKELQERIKTKH